MTDDTLIQLIYASAATEDLHSDEVLRILETARRENAKKGITGALLMDGHSFLQVLEGPADAVDALFSRITHDRRHYAVMRLSRRKVTTREFGDWSMGFGEVDRERAIDPENLPEGVNDFLQNGKSFSDLKVHEALGFMSAFREGFWHMEHRQMEPEVGRDVEVVFSN